MKRSARVVLGFAAFSGATLLAGCGSGGNGGPSFGGESGNGEATPGLSPPQLRVVWTDPVEGAEQVPVDTAPQIGCDATLIAASLDHPDSGLFAAAERVDGVFRLADDGRTITFEPTAQLAPDTDYRLRLSGMTAANDQRLLEGDFEVRFATLDATPPVRIAVEPDPTQRLDRLATLALRFDEPLATGPAQTARAELRDAFGTDWSLTVRVVDEVLEIDPALDLPGDRDFELTVRDVTDRFGNLRTTVDTIGFRTIPDLDPPHVVAIHPDFAAQIAPAAWPRLTFDESIDLASIEPGSVVIRDSWGNIYPLQVMASPDQRTLWLQPDRELPASTACKLLLATGPGGLTDLSGNPLLAASGYHLFETSSDREPPRLSSAAPAPDAANVPTTTRIELVLDQELDPVSIRPEVVALFGPDGESIGFGDLQLLGGNRVVATPARELLHGARHEIRLAGGPAGILDADGLPLPRPTAWFFTTAGPTTPPTLSVAPADGRSGVPNDVRVALWSDIPLDPTSVTAAGAFELLDDAGAPIAAEIELARGDRVVRIVPDGPLTPGAPYTLRVRGGAAGPRSAATGAGLADDLEFAFRCGFVSDPTPPQVRLTIDGIDARRSASLAVAPFGFGLDLVAADTGGGVDWSTAIVELDGPATAPDAERLFALGRVEDGAFRVRLPLGDALAPGVWRARARVADLSGNEAQAAEFAFEVLPVDANRLPFERTQVVWVRFDLDRDGNGREDFRDDLLRLGLCTAGDPLGTNERMERILRDGVLRRLRQLYCRTDDGGRDPDGPADSVGIVFTDREPRGVVAMQLACGGFDPQGEPGRGFGDDSSGTLGRAWFDYRNGRFDQDAIATSPGLGVFPAELWLFETAVHSVVYPSFVTRFARHFLPLTPDLGGTPAGAARDDSRALAADFDPETASPSERARWESVFVAADAWATAIGTIAAHEVGHALGLVAAGRDSNALHGDSSLHNEFAGIGDVMAAAVGYDAMTSVRYRFRDLNLAYLRQRVVLK